MIGTLPANGIAMLLSQIAAQCTLSENDLAVLDLAMETECDLGIKITVDAAGDVWSRASIRLNRNVEHLGRVEKREGFLAHFQARWYAGSA